MPHRDTIVVGASAGGVEALRTLLLGLPGDLRAVVLVVLHTPPSGVNALAAILSRCTELTVAPAEDGLEMTPGSVIVASPDHHLLVHDGQVRLTRGPRENGHRPAVDVLFRSAARALGSRVIGVVLSGALDDGSAGMIAIHAGGGICVVQDPEDAAQAGMPGSAIAAASPEHVLPVAEIPELLVRLLGPELGPGSGTVDDEPSGEPSELEGALWLALRSLEDKATLSQRLAEQVRGSGHTLSAQRFADQAGEASQAAGLLRRMLLDGTGFIKVQNTQNEVGEHMERLT